MADCALVGLLEKLLSVAFLHRLWTKCHIPKELLKVLGVSNEILAFIKFEELSFLERVDHEVKDFMASYPILTMHIAEVRLDHRV